MVNQFYILNSQKIHHRTVLGLFILSISLVMSVPKVTYAQLKTGDIVVADGNAGTVNAGGILQVNSSTGIRTLISDFGNPLQGEQGGRPFNLAIETTLNLLVVDYQLNKLFRVESATGKRMMLSDFSDSTHGPVADNTAGNGVSGIAIEKSGTILATARGAGTDFRDAILRVDPVTGQRIIVSDLGNPTQGVLGGQCAFGVVVEASGKILTTDCDNFGNASFGGLLFRIDPISGVRELLSDFGDLQQGNTAQSLGGIAIEPNGQILVVAPFAGTNGGGALFRVDPINGQRTLLNDFGDVLLGPTGSLLRNIAVESGNSILVVDQDVDDVIGPGAGAVFRVNLASGQRTLLSDFGNISQGPGSSPSGLAIVPSVAGATNPFKVFNTQLLLSKGFHNHDWFVAKGNFKLADIQGGIHPLSEPLVLSVFDKKGKLFEQTLPSGSFKHLGKSAYLFSANNVKSGLWQFLISPTKVTGQYTYLALAKNMNFDKNFGPYVTVSLQIGNDKGSKKVGCHNLLHLAVCR